MKSDIGLFIGKNNISILSLAKKLQNLYIGDLVCAKRCISAGKIFMGDGLLTQTNVADLHTIYMYTNDIITYMPDIPGLRKLYIDGKNTIQYIQFITGLKVLSIRGNNTISSISNMPGLEKLYIGGNNTISTIPGLERKQMTLGGPILEIQINKELEKLHIGGNNTISVIPDMPGLKTPLSTRTWLSRSGPKSVII